MRTLYLQCLMGAAGDMIMAALFELMDDDAKKDFLKTMNSLGLGIETAASKTKKCGIVGTRIEVSIDGEMEGSREHKEGEHFHHNHQHHHHQTDDKPLPTSSAPHLKRGLDNPPPPVASGDLKKRLDIGEADGEMASQSTLRASEGARPYESATPIRTTTPFSPISDGQKAPLHGRGNSSSHSDDKPPSAVGGHPLSKGGWHSQYESAEILREIEKTVSTMPLSDKVKNDVLSVYHLLADAEAHVHGCEISQIHFHEIGDADAIADIVGTCLLLEKIAPENIVCSAVNVGGGLVKCAHGILPVPAPATALLLEGIPIFSGDIKAELCTPTGAALIKYFAKSFGEMPSMIMQKTGYGMGKKDFEVANCLRAFLGDESSAGLKDKVIKLESNVDDMTGEALAFAMETLLNEGALDAWTQNIQMKKGRQGFLISCLCEEERADFFAALILKHISTFGVRKLVCPRYKLERGISKTKTALGEIRIKDGKGYGVEKSKPEYEDIAQAAREKGLSFNEALEKAKK